jgi:hypothetical protein
MVFQQLREDLRFLRIYKYKDKDKDKKKYKYKEYVLQIF